jgi:anhydro-N-acetylmuramic acid kinase
MGKKYKVIGIMSGTSLDGLDIAYCEFWKNKKWQYKIVFAETKKYKRKWKDKLSNAFKANKSYLKRLDHEYGKFIGKEILEFINKHNISVDFIASHGHTVFHQPNKKITLQIGSGASIASVCQLPAVFDFRSGDVELGGQGAPLVPIVDKLLFSKYDYCLNLGGFANISFDSKIGKRLAFDICPLNIVLNDLAGKLGKEFDR